MAPASSATTIDSLGRCRSTSGKGALASPPSAWHMAQFAAKSALPSGVCAHAEIARQQRRPMFRNMVLILSEKNEYPADVIGCWTRLNPVSYTHLRAHETGRNLVC